MVKITIAITDHPDAASSGAAVLAWAVFPALALCDGCEAAVDGAIADRRPAPG